jgi:flavin reductase (DIM6/NTAB) family NADH-FMN oxidoreductase RutF
MSFAAVDPDTFRRACSKFATGIAIATVVGPDGVPHGMTINSFASVSCVPPLVLVCIDYRCNILPLFRASAYYGINILSDDQMDLSVRFAQKGQDRFDGIDWIPGDTAAPRLPGALAFLECCVTQTVEAGDHAVFIGEVVRAVCQNGTPLLFFNSNYRHLK